MKAVLLSVLLLLLTGQCFAQAEAYFGIAADTASTAAGLAAGGAELNPLGLATIPLRLGAVAYANTLPDHAGQDVADAIDSTSKGAAAWNLCLLTGPAAGWCAAGAAVVGMLSWERNAPERDFFAACRRHKALFPETASLPCTRT